MFLDHLEVQLLIKEAETEKDSFQLLITIEISQKWDVGLGTARGFTRYRKADQKRKSYCRVRGYTCGYKDRIKY